MNSSAILSAITYDSVGKDDKFYASTTDDISASKKRSTNAGNVLLQRLADSPVYFIISLFSKLLVLIIDSIVYRGAYSSQIHDHRGSNKYYLEGFFQRNTPKECAFDSTSRCGLR